MNVKSQIRPTVFFLITIVALISGSQILKAETMNYLPYSKEKPFLAEMYSAIPSSINPAQIGSSNHYSLLLHLIRTPVRYTKDLQIEADLLQSWKISHENKNFLLTFKEHQVFSNGTKITAKFFKNVLDWQIQKKSSIHFDFTKIKSIKLINELALEIKMKTATKDFIRQLVHPEFGLYYNLSDEPKISEFNVSSGPYSINSVSTDGILLVKNSYYPSDINYPEWVLWRSSGVKKQLLGLDNGSVDFSVPHQAFGIEEHSQIVKNKNIKSFDPNMGYTFFISLNPKTSNFNSVVKRRSFLKFLSELELTLEKYAPIWEKANQLYLKGGLGRPSSSEISQAWRDIKSTKSLNLPTKLKLLCSSKFNFSTELIQYLQSHGIDVELTKYDDFTEYTELIKRSEFDLIQVNNDFSSIELLENLLVTFRESRPLILTNNTQIKKLLKSAEEAETIEQKSEIIKTIGLKIINDGLVYPVAHYKKLVYAKKNISFKKWSGLFPDMRIYKLEIDNAN